MKFKKHAAGLMAVSALLAMRVTYAGPEVEVTFRNKGGVEAVYDVHGSSAYSYGEANPKPAAVVKAGDFNVSKVKGSLSPDATSVTLQYRVGSKACKFKTAYIKLPGRGVAPKWSKSATSIGGARCDVRITSVDMASHAWAVEFTMR